MDNYLYKALCFLDLRKKSEMDMPLHAFVFGDFSAVKVAVAVGMQSVLPDVVAIGDIKEIFRSRFGRTRQPVTAKSFRFFLDKSDGLLQGILQGTLSKALLSFAVEETICS